MDRRLMSDEDLIDVTGKKRPSAQAAWFERQFGLKPVQRADGRIILTWAAFEAMQAKRMGVAPPNAEERPRPELLPLSRKKAAA